MAQRGGARPGAGRKKGVVSQAKRDLQAMAKGHAEKALQVLVDIAEGGESEAARVSAATAILDRGYGKPTQAVAVDGALTGALTVTYVASVSPPLSGEDYETEA